MHRQCWMFRRFPLRSIAPPRFCSMKFCFMLINTGVFSTTGLRSLRGLNWIFKNSQNQKSVLKKMFVKFWFFHSRNCSRIEPKKTWLFHTATEKNIRKNTFAVRSQTASAPSSFASSSILLYPSLWRNNIRGGYINTLQRSKISESLLRYIVVRPIRNNFFPGSLPAF